MEVDDDFEKMFRKVEEETERRAAWDTHTIPEDEEPEISQVVKETYRRSVPTSHLARLSDELTEMINANPMPSRRISAIPPQYMNRRSLDSLVSMRWQSEDTADKLSRLRSASPVGSKRQSSLSRAVGNLIPRRLGRSRSASVADVLASQDRASKVIVGVSVHKATSTDTHQPIPPATVHAGLSYKKSKSSLTSTDSLAHKLSQRVRRKSKSILSTLTC